MEDEKGSRFQFFETETQLQLRRGILLETFQLELISKLNWIL